MPESSSENGFLKIQLRRQSAGFRYAKEINPSKGFYGDSVEEALCFGWIDSTCKTVDGRVLQRFTPRQKKNSNWTELNRERCRRLIKIGAMTQHGKRVMPKHKFRIMPEVKAAFRKHPKAWKNFRSFPELYQRVRIDKLTFF